MAIRREALVLSRNASIPGSVSAADLSSSWAVKRMIFALGATCLNCGTASRPVSFPARPWSKELNVWVVFDYESPHLCILRLPWVSVNTYVGVQGGQGGAPTTSLMRAGSLLARSFARKCSTPAELARSIRSSSR